MEYDLNHLSESSIVLEKFRECQMDGLEGKKERRAKRREVETEKGKEETTGKTFPSSTSNYFLHWKITLSFSLSLSIFHSIEKLY